MAKSSVDYQRPPWQQVYFYFMGYWFFWFHRYYDHSQYLNFKIDLTSTHLIKDAFNSLNVSYFIFRLSFQQVTSLFKQFTFSILHVFNRFVNFPQIINFVDLIDLEIIFLGKLSHSFMNDLKNFAMDYIDL